MNRFKYSSISNSLKNGVKQTISTTTKTFKQTNTEGTVSFPQTFALRGFNILLRITFVYTWSLKPILFGSCETHFVERFSWGLYFDKIFSSLLCSAIFLRILQKPIFLWKFFGERDATLRMGLFTFAPIVCATNITESTLIMKNNIDPSEYKFNFSVGRFRRHQMRKFILKIYWYIPIS